MEKFFMKLFVSILISVFVIGIAVFFILFVLTIASWAGDNPVYEKPDVSGPYHVIVCFSSLEDYLKATGCAWVDRDVVATLFRNNGIELGKKEIYLITFERPIGTDQAIREMDRMGFTPATLLPLVALGVEHHEKIFPGYPIVALGSYCRDHRQELRVPQLWTFFGKNKLTLEPIDDGWRIGTRFAAVKYR